MIDERGRYVARPLEEILVLSDKQVHFSQHLKKRIIDFGLLTFKCDICEITEWLGEPAPLQIDHIDGNRFDNRIENLRFLCPNCHAQTPTFAGRNNGTGLKVEVRTKQCRDCTNLIVRKATWCKPCGYKNRGKHATGIYG